MMKKPIIFLFVLFYVINVYANNYIYYPADSPGLYSYNSNTYTEKGWADIDVLETDTIEFVEISYNWNGEEGSYQAGFYIKSPLGDTVEIAAYEQDGEYTHQLPEFRGTPMNGTWKLWIEDFHGSGKHQATNITLTFYYAPDHSPFHPLPGDEVEGVDYSGKLSWKFDSSIIAYDLLFGKYGSTIETDALEDNIDFFAKFNPTLMDTVLSGEIAGDSGSYNYSNLDPLSDYLWKVIAYDSSGDTLCRPLPWRFQTKKLSGMKQIGDSNLMNKMLPINTGNYCDYTQTIYDSSKFQVIDSSKRITKIFYNIKKTETAELSHNTWDIYLGTTNKSNLDSGYISADSLTKVFDGSFEKDTLPVGDDYWMPIKLTIPFNYNPSTDGNLVIATDKDKLSFMNGLDQFYCDIDSTENVSRYYYNLYNPIDPDPFSPPEGTPSNAYPNIVFQFDDTPDTTEFSCLPDSFSFDTINIDAASEPVKFSIFNTGAKNTSMTVNSVRINGSNKNEFTLIDTNNYSYDIISGKSIDVKVIFEPIGEGIRNADIEVITASSDTHKVSLTGTGYNSFIDSFPYFQSFDSVSRPNLPSDWLIINDINNDYSWVRGFGNSGWHHSYPNYAEIRNNEPDSGNLMLISPPTNLNISNSRISFYLAVPNIKYTDKIIVGTINDPDSADTFAPIDTIEALTDYTNYKQNFVYLNDVSITSPVYIAFKHSLNNFSTFLIDDFTWEEIPDTAILNVNIDSIDFEHIIIGNESDTSSISISNHGGDTITIDSIFIDGINPDQFNLFYDSDYPVELTGGESIELGISFDPDSEGVKKANLIIYTPKKDTHYIYLSGSGLERKTLPFIDNFNDGTISPFFAETTNNGIFKLEMYSPYSDSGSYCALFTHSDTPLSWNNMPSYVNLDLHLDLSANNKHFTKLDFFYQALENENNNELLLFSNDNGVSWDTLFIFPSESEPYTWIKKSFDFSDYNDNFTDECILRWQFNDYYYYFETKDGLAIDYVSLYEFTPNTKDVGVKEINNPQKALKNNYEPKVIKCTVENFGSSDQTDIPVIYKIDTSGGDFTSPLLADTIDVDVNTEQKGVFSFTRDFDPPDSNQFYCMQCYTVLSGDEDLSNDTVYIEFEIWDLIQNNPVLLSWDDSDGGGDKENYDSLKVALDAAVSENVISGYDVLDRSEGMPDLNKWEIIVHSEISGVSNDEASDLIQFLNSGTDTSKKSLMIAGGIIGNSVGYADTNITAEDSLYHIYLRADYTNVNSTGSAEMTGVAVNNGRTDSVNADSWSPDGIIANSSYPPTMNAYTWKEGDASGDPAGLIYSGNTFNTIYYPFDWHELETGITEFFIGPSPQTQVLGNFGWIFYGIQEDTIPPYFISCPGDTTVCGTQSITYVLPEAGDNFSVDTISQIQGLPSGSTFSPGETVNTFIAYDIKDNTDTCSFNVTVNAKPENFNISGPELVAENQIANYTVPEDSTLKYFWNVKSGNISDSITNDSVLIKWGLSDTGYVDVLSKNQFNCFSDTSKLKIIIDVQTYASTISDNEIIVYPNPADNHIYVYFDKPYTMDIFNNAGIKILSSKNRKTDISRLMAGVYVIVIRNDNNKVLKSIKIIKQ